MTGLRIVLAHHCDVRLNEMMPVKGTLQKDVTKRAPASLSDGQLGEAAVPRSLSPVFLAVHRGSCRPNESKQALSKWSDGDFGDFIFLEWKWGSRLLTNGPDPEPAPQHLRFFPVPSAGTTRVPQLRRQQSHHHHNRAQGTGDDAPGWVQVIKQILSPPSQGPHKSCFLKKTKIETQ